MSLDVRTGFGEDSGRRRPRTSPRHVNGGPRGSWKAHRVPSESSRREERRAGPNLRRACKEKSACVCRHRACASVGLSRPRRRTRSTPSHNLIKALATCGRGRPKSAVGGFGSRQPTTIVGCNCHEIIGKALLCVRCRRWKHSSQVSGAALKMLASLKGGQAVELLGRAIYSKIIRGTKIQMCTKHPRCRLGPCAAVARPAALFVCVSILLEQRSEHVGSTPQWQNCAKWG